MTTDNKIYKLFTTDKESLLIADVPNGAVSIDAPDNVDDADALWIWWGDRNVLSPYSNPLKELGAADGTGTATAFYDFAANHASVVWDQIIISGSTSAVFQNRTGAKVRVLTPVDGSQDVKLGNAKNAYNWTLEEAPPAEPKVLGRPLWTSTSTEVVLTWEPNHPKQFWVDHYEIRQKNGKQWIKLSPTTVPKLTVKNLTPSTQYEFQVSAVTADDRQSNWSLSATATTKKYDADFHRGTKETVVVFEDQNLLGNVGIVQKPVPNTATLSADWAGGIKSAVVANGWWIVYDNANFAGPFYTLSTSGGANGCGRYYSPSDWGSTLPAQSVTQLCVSLYENQLYQGKAIQFFSETIADTNKQAVPTVNSLQVRDGIWEVYSEAGFSGRRYVVSDKGGPNKDGSYPDPASWKGLPIVCIRAYRPVVLSLYYDANLVGNSVEVLDEDVSKLGNLKEFKDKDDHHFNNIVSSIQVWEGAWAGFLEENYKGEFYLRFHSKGGPTQDGIYPTLPSWADNKLSSFRAIGLTLTGPDVLSHPSVDVWGDEVQQLTQTELGLKANSVWVYSGIWNLEAEGGTQWTVSYNGGPNKDGIYPAAKDWLGVPDVVYKVSKVGGTAKFKGLLPKEQRGNTKTDPVTWRIVAPDFCGESIPNYTVPARVSPSPIVIPTQYFVNATRHKVTWTAPNDNGAKIDFYRVQYRLIGAPDWTEVQVVAPKLEVDVDLQVDLNKRLYEFGVTAHNAAGYGETSYLTQAETSGFPVWDRNRVAGPIQFINDSSVRKTTTSCGTGNVVVVRDGVTKGVYSWAISSDTGTYTGKALVNEKYKVGDRPNNTNNGWWGNDETTRIVVDADKKEARFYNSAGGIVAQYTNLSGTTFYAAAVLCHSGNYAKVSLPGLPFK
eukprot:Phypoly_transcript_02291.p1 GENE.Phypoly_transcript_02291~~Phypoly_transcript_02291.p1  ORF type:complete len:891 (-),score=142.05 Phypoly_transcript_02291:184-2856(-)